MKKKYFILSILPMLLFCASEVKAFELNDFTTAISSEGGTVRTNSEDGKSVLTIDLTGSQYSIVYDEANNTVSQNLPEGNTESIENTIANSWLLKQVLSLSSTYKNNQNTIFTVDKIKEVPWDKGTDEEEYCALDITGICYNDLFNESITIKLDETTANYILSFYNTEGTGTGNIGGQQQTVIDTGGQKASVDPQTYQEGEANPTTGTFAEYSVLIVMIIGLIILSKYIKKNDVKYKI